MNPDEGASAKTLESNCTCAICEAKGDGKNARRDHATGIGFLLHDLCGAEGALVARGHSLDTMIHEINHMVKILPDDCGRLWEVDGKSLCFCFVCPCCSQLLPSGKANAHMVVALDAVRHMLSPQVQDRFKTQLKPRGDLAGRRAMREILRAVGPDVWKVLGARAPSSQAGSQAGGAAQPPLDCRSLRPQAEVHWCGSPAGQKPSAVQAWRQQVLHSLWEAARDPAAPLPTLPPPPLELARLRSLPDHAAPAAGGSNAAASLKSRPPTRSNTAGGQKRKRASDEAGAGANQRSPRARSGSTGSTVAAQQPHPQGSGGSGSVGNNVPALLALESLPIDGHQPNSTSSHRCELLASSPPLHGAHRAWAPPGSHSSLHTFLAVSASPGSGAAGAAGVAGALAFGPPASYTAMLLVEDVGNGVHSTTFPPQQLQQQQQQAISAPLLSTAASQSHQPAGLALAEQGSGTGSQGWAAAGAVVMGASGASRGGLGLLQHSQSQSLPLPVATVRAPRPAVPSHQPPYSLAAAAPGAAPSSTPASTTASTAPHGPAPVYPYLHAAAGSTAAGAAAAARGYCVSACCSCGDGCYCQQHHHQRLPCNDHQLPVAPPASYMGNTRYEHPPYHQWPPHQGPPHQQSPYQQPPHQHQLYPPQPHPHHAHHPAWHLRAYPQEASGPGMPSSAHTLHAQGSGSAAANYFGPGAGGAQQAAGCGIAGGGSGDAAHGQHHQHHQHLAANAGIQVYTGAQTNVPSPEAGPAGPGLSCAPASGACTAAATAAAIATPTAAADEQALDVNVFFRDDEQ